MAERALLESLLRPYRRRLRLLAVWDGLLSGLLFSLMPALLSVFIGINVWIYSLFIFCLAGGLFKHLRGLELTRSIDEVTLSGGEVITLAGYLDKGDSGPFIPLLLERVRVRLVKKPVTRCLPVNFRRRLGRSLGLLVVLGALIFLPQVTGAKQPAPYEIVRNSASRLAKVSEKDPSFTPMAERLDELQQKLSDDPLQEKEAEVLAELSTELTGQIREIERNSLNRFFEERGTRAADSLESLSRGDLSLPETRELIMDLLESSSIDGNKGKSIRQSYQDFTDPSDGPRLAEDLMDDLDPGSAELVSELKDVLHDLESLTGETGGSGEDAETAGTPEDERGGRESRRTGDEGGESAPSGEAGGEAAMTAAGSSPGAADEAADFEPWEGESPEARLPEGEIRQTKKQGILRLEGDEDFNLERISPDYNAGERVAEEEIPVMTIPENNTRLVRDYFTSIGAEPGRGGGNGEFE